MIGSLAIVSGAVEQAWEEDGLSRAKRAYYLAGARKRARNMYVALCRFCRERSELTT